MTVILSKLFHVAVLASTSVSALTASAPSSISNIDSGSEVFTGGFATAYDPSGIPGTCGITYSDSDFVVALSSSRYGPPDVQSPLCGMQVSITDVNNGETTTAIIGDDCIFCTNENSFDVSDGLFSFFEPPSTGTFPIEWSFV